MERMMYTAMNGRTNEMRNTRNVLWLKWYLELRCPEAMLVGIRGRANLGLTSPERLDRCEALLSPEEESLLGRGQLTLADCRTIAERLRHLVGADCRRPAFRCPQAERIPFRRHRLGQALRVQMNAAS